MSYFIHDILKEIEGDWINEKESATVQTEEMRQLASLANSKKHDISFFFSRFYEEDLKKASPSVLITGKQFLPFMIEKCFPQVKNVAIILCDQPYSAFAHLSQKFSFGKGIQFHETSFPSTLSWIHPSVVLGKDVHIGPYCTIEEGVSIEEGTIVSSGSHIGPRCHIGKKCILFPQVVLYPETILGDRVRIHSGSVIGSDGFGYAPVWNSEKKCLQNKKIIHLGKVVIEEDVEIGSNTSIDRGTIGETRIEKDVKIDNLVHIGHNARIAQGAIVCGGTCLAGNAMIGSYAQIGGLVGVGNQVCIGEKAQVGALSLVTKDIPPRGTAVGNPQRTYQEHFKGHALLNKMLKKWRSQS